MSSTVIIRLVDGYFVLPADGKIFRVAPQLEKICSNFEVKLDNQFRCKTFQNFLYLTTIGVYAPHDLCTRDGLIQIMKLCHYFGTDESTFECMMDKAGLVDFIQCLVTTIPVLFFMHKYGYASVALKYANHIYLDPSTFEKTKYHDFRRGVRNYYRLRMFQRFYFSWRCLCGTCREINKIQQGHFFSGNEGTVGYQVWPRTHDIGADPSRYPVPWEERNQTPLPPIRQCWLRHRCRRHLDPY